jgi:23S rRNA pseudouridine2604 synthase
LRINKYISETGICSRREADQIILDRRVTINGKVAGLGDTVAEGDKVHVDGKLIGQKKKNVYIVLNKPVGITSTTERHIKGNIVDFVNHSERIFPIGRLDKDSDGLILLTNDGDVVNRILRAENNHDKEYIVTVDKPITLDFIRGMANGVMIEGKMTKKCKVSKVQDNVFRIILTEGRNRQIRKMCKAFGYAVRRLQRIRIMNIKLGSLKIGHWRNLTSKELQELFKQISYNPEN